MKKFVSFCVAAAVAVCAVPAMAQCTSCGGGAPAFSQPVMSYAPQATYSAPVMSQQVYSQPVYSQPAYSAPVMSQPVYSAPIVSAPMMSQPVYSSPIVSSAPVYNSAPIASAPIASAPIASGCNSCGGTVMGGAVMGGEVIVSGGMNAAPMGTTIGGGQIISWEGGTEIQGTIVSDVVVEGGEAVSTEGAVEAGNSVDVVEPPAAATEESPGPDSDEESTEGET